MKHRLGVPYRKICDFFSTYCNLTIRPAALVRAEQRLTDLLLDALRRAEVVHADETDWRIGRLNAWLWVFSNQEATVYAIRQIRGHEVPEAILGLDFVRVFARTGRADDEQPSRTDAASDDDNA